MQQHEVGQTQGFWDVRYICGLVMRVRGGRGTMGADPHACRLVCVTEGTCTCGRRVGRGVYVPFAPTQADLGVADSTSSFSTNSGTDAGIVRKGERSRTVTREVPSLDFALWLSTHVKPQDFVVVKMDIESMEFELLPHLIRRGVAPLIDELFVECHCVESFNHRCGRKYAECIDLHRRSYEAGIWVHDWD